MKNYIVRWNTGYGDNYEEVEAKTKEEAEEIAYDLWNQDIQDNADYSVEGEATDELRDGLL